MLHFARVLGANADRRFDAAGSVRSFLLTRGFREDRSAAGLLRFTRSSHLATVFAFDPSRWRIELHVEPRTRGLQMFVHTDGQVVTPRERQYFEAFFAELAAVTEPECSSARAMTIWGDQSLSRRAARAAVSENVMTMLGFLFSFPTLILLLHAAVSVPMFWAICWAFGGSVAIAYASLFSARNRRVPKT